MILLSQTAWFFRRKLLELLRQPAWVAVGLSTPLLYLALFTPLLDALAGGPGFQKTTVLDIFVPGILVLMAFGAGMGAGWIAVWEVQTGVLERFTVSPANRFALLLGTVLRDVVAFAVPATAVILVAIPFGFTPHWTGLAVLLVLLSFVTAGTSAWSTGVGLGRRDIGSLAAIVTGLQLPLTLLGGVLLPISLGPGWLQALAHVDPLYYAVTAARDLAAGTIASASVGLGFLVLGALLVVTLAWGTRAYRTALA